MTVMTKEQIEALLDNDPGVLGQIARDALSTALALHAQLADAKAAQAMVRHVDDMNDLVLMGLARDEAIADRDRLAAANAALEARLANGMKWCDLMDGPVSKSQFVNGQATAAQQIRAALAEVQADARREGA